MTLYNQLQEAQAQGKQLFVFYTKKSLNRGPVRVRVIEIKGEIATVCFAPFGSEETEPFKCRLSSLVL